MSRATLKANLAKAEANVLYWQTALNAHYSPYIYRKLLKAKQRLQTTTAIIKQQNKGTQTQLPL